MAMQRTMVKGLRRTMVVKGLIMSRSGTRAGMQSNLAVVIRRLMSPKMTLVVMGKRRLMVITMIMGLKGVMLLLLLMNKKIPRLPRRGSTRRNLKLMINL